ILYGRKIAVFEFGSGRYVEDVHGAVFDFEDVSRVVVFPAGLNVAVPAVEVLAIEESNPTVVSLDVVPSDEPGYTGRSDCAHGQAQGQRFHMRLEQTCNNKSQNRNQGP